METMNLKESPVLFDPEQHTYTLNGNQLSGVTPIIAWLFPNTYQGIPQSVLNKAAEYGSLIHSKCELADSMGIVTESIVCDYKRIIENAGLQVAVSEYLVSDERNIASAIDKVFTDDSLGDIKTTSKVHIPNVQVQLSIYAWLYEMQTGRTVNKLYLIWLPKPQYGAPELRELNRIPAEVCQHVVEVYLNGGDPVVAIMALSNFVTFEPERKRVEGEIPDGVQEVVDELMVVKKQLDFFTDREKELKGMLMQAMQDTGDDKWSNDLIQISRKAAYERESIDTKSLKANEPSIYESYKKVTKVAESLTYKVL